MALHDDLLLQARELASMEPTRPKQASLRRATSAAYYAVFHLLVNDSTRFLVAGRRRERLRRVLARSFEHGHMKLTAQLFTAGKSGGKAWRALLSSTPSSTLARIASDFIALQESRHDADYDLARVFRRTETLALVAQAQDVFDRWASIKGSEEGDTFLVALLVRGRR